MAFTPGEVETLTVDSYGTLVDPYAAERALANRVEESEPVTSVWRSRSLTYTMVGNAIGEYQSFWEMNRDALAYALATHGYDLPQDEQDEILEVYHELDPFEDVRDGLEAISDAGYPIYVLSNGSPEMLSSMVDHADLTDIIEDAISVHEIQTFKPEPAVYQHASERTETPIENIAHAASPTFDVQGAKAAGMQGIWLDRAGDPWETFGPEPDLVTETFYEVAEALA